MSKISKTAEKILSLFESKQINSLLEKAVRNAVVGTEPDDTKNYEAGIQELVESRHIEIKGPTLRLIKGFNSKNPG